ncbi:MAG TPA: hypothetical protein VFH68_04065 [Polyangia bacterium]|jgi:hypothetical protein|nr:hypothetical protein [Polyangia bacterium]
MTRSGRTLAGGRTAVFCGCLIAARAAVAAGPPVPPASVVSVPTAPPVAPTRPRYFYFGLDYGSQSLFSPLWVFLNRGYDVLQDHVASRNIFEQRYRVNSGNVLDNLAHPFANISAVGWKPFLTEEIFPLRFGGQSARWVPNYTLHLIGGGVTYTALAEWFDDRAVPLPHLWSGLTLLAAALVNETIENKGVVGPNTDALADIYVFDIAAMILFSFDAPNRFFSRVLVVSDWSLQPSFTFPRGELHDQGNNFAARWALPFYPRLRLFTYFGLATEVGLSFLIDDEYSLSAAAGSAATRLVNESTRRVANTVTFTPTAGAYLDRRDSLLASVQITDVNDYFMTFNLYPRAVVQRGPALGAWTVIDKHAHVALGISISRLLGVGLGWSGL